MICGASLFLDTESLPLANPPVPTAFAQEKCAIQELRVFPGSYLSVVDIQPDCMAMTTA